MSLVTPGTVLSHTVVDDIDHAQTVTKFGLQAEERMREALTADRSRSELLGFEVVDELIDRVGHRRNRGDLYDAIVDGDDPWTQSDKEDLAQAETVYAFAEALPSLNIHITDGRGLVQATGYDQNRVRYRSEASIAQLQKNLKSGAVRIAVGLQSRHDRDDPDPVYVL